MASTLMIVVVDWRLCSMMVVLWVVASGDYD